jgi:N-acetylglutamate synthase-like GNAT family acetyltransferase
MSYIPMVRKARESDYDSIITLRNSYLLDRDQLMNPDYTAKLQREGFLIRNYTKTDFMEDLQNELYVYEINGEVVAYIRIEHKIDSDFQYDRLNVWMNNDYKDVYFNEAHHVELGSICVKKELQESGVLKELLQTVINDLKDKGAKHLFSSIVYGPVINTFMMAFHEECGFEKVCLTTSSNMNDMQNYQGMLYVKNL